MDALRDDVRAAQHVRAPGATHADLMAAALAADDRERATVYYLGALRALDPHGADAGAAPAALADDAFARDEGLVCCAGPSRAALSPAELARTVALLARNWHRLAPTPELRAHVARLEHAAAAALWSEAAAATALEVEDVVWPLREARLCLHVHDALVPAGSAPAPAHPRAGAVRAWLVGASGGALLETLEAAFVEQYVRARVPLGAAALYVRDRPTEERSAASVLAHALGGVHALAIQRVGRDNLPAQILGADEGRDPQAVACMALIVFGMHMQNAHRVDFESAHVVYMHEVGARADVVFRHAGPLVVQTGARLVVWSGGRGVAVTSVYSAISLWLEAAARGDGGGALANAARATLDAL